MMSRSQSLAASCALAVLFASPLHAQTGLLLVAHGAGPEWNAPVRDLLPQVAWRHGPVAIAFLMGPEAKTNGWDQGVAALDSAGARGVVVVPLMVSSHGSHYRQVEFYSGVRSDLPAELAAHDHRTRPHDHPAIPMRVTPALDDAPELGVALTLRWQALPAIDRARPLVLVAHGPSAKGDLVSWLANLGAVARVLRTGGLAADAKVALLQDDAPPDVRAAAVRAMRDTITSLVARGADSVVVMPVLISTSRLSTLKVPADLEGLPVRYSRAPLAPLPPLAWWIARVAEEHRHALEVASTR